MNRYRCMKSLVSAIVVVALWDTPGHARHGELPNRIPEAAPYNVTEAETYPPLVAEAASFTRSAGDGYYLVSLMGEPGTAYPLDLRSPQ